MIAFAYYHQARDPTSPANVQRGPEGYARTGMGAVAGNRQSQALSQVPTLFSANGEKSVGDRIEPTLVAARLERERAEAKGASRARDSCSVGGAR